MISHLHVNQLNQQSLSNYMNIPLYSPYDFIHTTVIANQSANASSEATMRNGNGTAGRERPAQSHLYLKVFLLLSYTLNY